MKTKLLLLLVVLYQISFGQVNLDSGLVVYYPFNGNANDSSIYHNNGTVYGASITDDRFGNENSAYYFDGIDDFIEISPITNLDSVCDFSISVWFRLADWEIQPSDNWKSLVDLPYIFDGHAKSSVDISDIITDGFNISLGLDESYKSYVLTSTKDLDGNVFISQLSPGTALLDQWCHCVFIREGDTTRSYINGKLISEDLNDGVSLNMNHPLYIGTFAGNNKNYNSFNYNFNGKIDDVRVYSRALNYDEIDSLYDKYDQINNTEEGLIAYYPLDSTFNDMSGNGFDAENHGVTFGSDLFGKNNAAAYFENAAYLVVPHDNKLNFGTENFSISLWVKSNSDARQMICQKGGINEYDDPQYWIRLNDQQGTASFTTGNGTRNSIITTCKNNIADNEWHHIVAVRMDSLHQLFVDNHPVAQTIAAPQNTDNDQDLKFGLQKLYYGDINPFSGYLDEIKIFSKALSENNISDLYNEHIPPVKLDSGLVAYYPFDGNAYDYSGNNLHADVNGPELAYDRFGNTNNAYSFDGINDYMVVKDTDLLNPNEISICLWYKPDYFVGIGNNSLIDKGHYSDTTPQYHVGVSGDYKDYSRYRFACDINTKNARTGNRSENYIWEPGKWYFISMTFDGETCKLYVNDELIDTKLNIGILNAFTHDLYIGKSGDREDNVPGVIDDIRIYSRAISYQEMQELYSEVICKERNVIDTAIYYVSSKEFEAVSPQTYYKGIDTLISIYGCDSIVTQYEKYIFDPNYCTESVTDSVSVTDTLIIDVTFTNNQEEDMTNRILIYPNPTRDMVTINTGSYYNQISGHKILITDVTGRVVFESYISEPIYQINIDEFGDPGMYLIQIMNSANHVTDTRKLILE
ncbi:LamG-like jellyroll fold domain-containing protein [Saccharicrinis sp. FJH2]|uniref:LamG-like jellyroll fold domain-containing protein n=1 Tax=Saccharicrinis sp. FJH65 TaxID=3344659 RepID=UPI0035F4FD2F